MGGQKIYCRECCHWQNPPGNICSQRKIFVRPNKGRYCQDFSVIRPILKPKPELIPEPKLEPVKQEPVYLAPAEEKPEIKNWWQRIIDRIKIILKWRKK